MSNNKESKDFDISNLFKNNNQKALEEDDFWGMTEDSSSIYATYYQIISAS